MVAQPLQGHNSKRAAGVICKSPSLRIIALQSIPWLTRIYCRRAGIFLKEKF